MIKKLITLAAIPIGIALAPPAGADPGIGCETLRWGIFGQLRTICDGPQNSDGSWMRLRIFWTPAHYVPFRCYSSTYSSSCSGGYHVDDTLQGQEKYLVFPHNVLHDEPGWLPPGTDVLR